MNDYQYIFDDAEKIYKYTGSKLSGFRFARDLYGFCINVGGADNEALKMAKNINEELYNKFINQSKSLLGYEGYEKEYCKIDDLDSKHILILVYLLNNNSVSYNNIIEIGGGFGNMCRLSNNIIDYNSWNIIDIPHMIELQKYYLENEIKNIDKIKFTDAHSNYLCNDIDLVIATHSISEFSWDIFLNYFNNVISKSKFFYIGYNKNCPSPQLIYKKIKFILENGFVVKKKLEYTEPLGAEVSYTLFENVNI